MKLLIITTNFPRWAGDPHSPWLVELLGLLRQRGYQIEILAPAYAGQDSHVIDGMPVHRFRYAPARWETLTHEAGAPAKIRRNPLYLLLLPFYLLAGTWAAWRLARRHPFDVIHVHWPVPQGIFGVVARWAVERQRGKGKSGSSAAAQITLSSRPLVPASSPRLVATFYGADLVLAQRFRFVIPFLRWFTRRCDGVAAISSYTCRALMDLTGTASRTIPYGIALPAADVEWPTEPGKILYVGRLIPRKGVRYLVEAMALLRDLPESHLVIVGDGPERANLEAIAEAQGLADRVAFAGRVASAELEEHYRTCHVFVLPSIVDPTGDTEMLGMVLLEAMRYRKPVIASNVGGIPDIVQHAENGLLVPQQDPEALSTALRRLLADDALAGQLGEAGYAYARNHFSWEAVVRETEGLYERRET